MKKLRIIFMILLISVTSPQSKANENCKEIQDACIEVINKADELIKAQNAEILFLKDTQKELMSRLETQEKLILDMANPPWYSTPTTIFLLGIITGGILHEKVFNH